MIATFTKLFNRWCHTEGETMIKVDSIGAEYCLPCADELDIEGVIVDRESECVNCETN